MVATSAALCSTPAAPAPTARAIPLGERGAPRPSIRGLGAGAHRYRPEGAIIRLRAGQTIATHDAPRPDPEEPPVPRLRPHRMPLVVDRRCAATTPNSSGASHRISRFTPPTAKVERFNRTLVDEFAYARTFTSNTARLDALPRWVRYYNTRRRHTSLEGHTPTEIVNNLCGKNT
jgi:hypothetical protein